IENLLDTIQKDMLDTARQRLNSKTTVVKNMDEFKTMLEEKPGFAKAMWCGCPECEAQIKEETSATIRCIPFEQEDLGTHTCFHCGKEADTMVIVAKAY
ncbi:MAG: proline--tRNA ligase, partial [Clostridioides sp.]|nr:proline--tRNA ligase [Clostridioides sp.]